MELVLALFGLTVLIGGLLAVALSFVVWMINDIRADKAKAAQREIEHALHIERCEYYAALRMERKAEVK